MKEIEVKILNINKSKMRKKLLKLGAKQTLKPTLFKELYFTDPQDKNNKRKYSSFRLRLEGKKAKITLKQKTTGKKQQDELSSTDQRCKRRK